MQRINLAILAFLFVFNFSFGQQDRFEPEIRAFEKEDSIKGYKQDFVLLTGSSSIRLWHSMESDLKGLNILNRGFGGSTLKALNKDWKRIAGSHQPDVVVLYCGENDIAEGAPVEETVAQFERFLEQYAVTYPDVPLIYIAMKPSISRWELWDQYQEADVAIKEIISKREGITFIDLSTSMFIEEGTLKKDIFLEDGLHMNKKGYKGWKKQLRPLIKSKLDQ